MRRLKVDNITAAVASSELTNFEDEYLVDDFQGRLWKAGTGVTRASVLITVGLGVTDIMIFNTNAELVNLSAVDTMRMEWGGSDTWGGSDEWGGYDVDGSGLSPTITYGKSNIHIKLDSILTPCEINISMTANEQLYAGKIIAGIAETYGDSGPQYGLNVTFTDRSNRSEYPRYYSKRTTPTIWNASLLLETAEAEQLMDDFDDYGAANCGMAIASDRGAFVRYGYVQNPSISYSYPNHSSVSFTFVEAK